MSIGLKLIRLVRFFLISFLCLILYENSLEEQHNAEIESYFLEIIKWQSEVDKLRRRLFKDRVLYTKRNITLLKELQEKDDKIQELILNCQRLQNEIELLEATNRLLMARGATDHPDEQRINDIIFHGEQRDHAHTENLRKQLQFLMKKEKIYKHEIAELKQRVSRSYMAVKTQEKKTSQREVQLEKKTKYLKEELEKMRIQLEREYLVQENRRAKTAEELLLWEKQKKWQQTAEKLQVKLKEKTSDYVKLNSNHEKLRTLVFTMEREKLFLKSKIKEEATTSSATNDIPSRPMSSEHQNLVIDLQRECQTLRERIGELEGENIRELLKTINEQKNCIASLEIVTKGNEYVVEKLQKLKTTKDALESANLKLESENFELRLKIEKANADTSRLREKVGHLERYIELLKVEKSSKATPRSCIRECQELNYKKTILELEKKICTLKRTIEKLQTENKRLKFNARGNNTVPGKKVCNGNDKPHEKLYEELYVESQRRVIDLETDLQLAEQKLIMLEKTEKDDEKGEIDLLKQQLAHKSELLGKVKQLLTNAAKNEKTLRQQLQQLERKQTLSPIQEFYVNIPNMD